MNMSEDMKATPPRVLAWLMRRFTREDPVELWRGLRLGPERGGAAFLRGAYVIGALVTTAYAALSLVLLGSIPRADGLGLYYPVVLIALLLGGGMGTITVMIDMDGPSRA